MKKLICSAIVAAMASGSAFAQGYMIFSSGTGNGLYDNFTTKGTPVKDALMDVGFIWVDGSGATYSALGSTASANTGTATLASNPWSSLTALTGGWAWGSVLTTPVAVKTTATPPPAAGDFTAGTIGVAGSSASEVITVYVVAWSSAYTTYAAAAAANSAIGWSTPFTYTLGSSTAPGGNLSAAFSSFYVDAVPVPEPCTMALLGLGGLSLLMIRRRK